MNKYKEQMNKISVDNDMKRRIINNIKKSKTEEVKKSIFKNQMFYKYGGFMAACCAFAVTYAITLNYPELISEKDIPLNDSQYSLKNKEDEDLERENNNDFIVEKNEENFESIDKEVENVNKDEDLNYRDQKNISSHDSSQEIQNIDSEKDNIKSKDIKEESNMDYNKINTVSEEDTNSKNKENENKENDDNQKLKAVSYEENPINNPYFQYSIPDFGECGFDIIYLNHIFRNEAEIMYSNNEINIFVKIYDKEDINIENNYNIISHVEYNGKEVMICTDNKNNIETIVYLKDNYFYCVSSNINIDENFLNKILEYI